MTVIVRREEDETLLYTHFGTGNYHPGNARLYTDLSYFTCNRALGKDANKVFNYLTSGSFPTCELLVVAPRNIRRELLQLIDIEIENAKNGKPAQIMAKLNSLTDPKIINKFYEASTAGVVVELVVRRQCRLRPGLPGLSENISVKSIVGRYLEHSRIYCFANGETLPGRNAKVFISSADWMERNFDDRVEIMIPITDPVVHQQVLDDVMLKNIEDTAQSWRLTPEGKYERMESNGFSVQNWFMQNDSRSG
jgi:polyphosphate kinase